MNPNARKAGRRVYDPRGPLEVEAVPLAPRVRTLEGLRLGVLNNTKWNCGKFLERTVGLLGEEFSFQEVHFYKKESQSKYAAPELIERIAAENDVALTAIGD